MRHYRELAMVDAYVRQANSTIKLVEDDNIITIRKRLDYNWLDADYKFTNKVYNVLVPELRSPIKLSRTNVYKSDGGGWEYYGCYSSIYVGSLTPYSYSSSVNCDADEMFNLIEKQIENGKKCILAIRYENRNQKPGDASMEHRKRQAQAHADCDAEAFFKIRKAATKVATVQDIATAKKTLKAIMNDKRKR
ncbi:MAG: hypothetical protein FWD15_01350 [Alphaproteobacteria bacterium]|nr:hypothetical protein [Alphaproteobacteria bacterium]